jgi:hypothetical protein
VQLAAAIVRLPIALQYLARAYGAEYPSPMRSMTSTSTAGQPIGSLRINAAGPSTKLVLLRS